MFCYRQEDFITHGMQLQKGNLTIFRNIYNDYCTIKIQRDKVFFLGIRVWTENMGSSSLD